MLLRRLFHPAILAALFVIALNRPQLAQGSRQQDDTVQFNKWRNQAQTAFDKEMAREKAGDCPNANNTYEINACLGKEAAITASNYEAFVEALRSLLELLNSEYPSDAIGPGKALTAGEVLKEFDQVEAAWNTYYHAQCSAVYNDYKGGTIAPSMKMSCELLLTRNRMRELNQIYDGELRH